MSGELSDCDLSAINYAEFSFDRWDRDDIDFFRHAISKPAILYVLSNCCYPVLVKRMNMVPIEKRSEEELDDIIHESLKFYIGDDVRLKKKIYKVIAVIVHIGELRVRNQEKKSK